MMKTISKVIHSIFITGILISTGSFCITGIAQTPVTNLKIGTYDSRVVVIAYTRSDYFVQQQMKSRKEGNELMQSNDTVKKIEAFYKVLTEQYLLHQRGFSNGSSASILTLVKDKLPVVAKDAGVSAIISKWELTFVDPSAEIVDITMSIARLYNPTGDFEKIATGLAKMDPVPLEDLPMNEVIEMWKQFESKYLSKK
jgi:hypothetical protein